jgi:hypothetical protein
VRRSFALVAILLVSACTGRTTTITSAATTVTTAVTTTTLAMDQALSEFRACLEDQGVVVPDLPLSESGRPDLGPLAIANDASSGGFRSALADCATILAANGILDLGDDAELKAEVRRQLERFAVCMRDSGVEGFPDPVEGFAGQGVPFPVIPMTDPELGRAIDTCSTALGIAPLTG